MPVTESNGNIDEKQPWTATTTPEFKPETMKSTQQLHDLGQSLWLDNITRDLLNQRTLRRYIDEFSVTGLTSNPTILITPSRTARLR